MKDFFECYEVSLKDIKIEKWHVSKYLNIVNMAVITSYVTLFLTECRDMQDLGE